MLNQLAAYQVPKTQSKHLFTVGFTGRCKRTGNMISGRLQLMAQDTQHAFERTKSFYSGDFTELDIYGAHKAYQMVA